MWEGKREPEPFGPPAHNGATTSGLGRFSHVARTFIADPWRGRWSPRRWRLVTEGNDTAVDVDAAAGFIQVDGREPLRSRSRSPEQVIRMMLALSSPPFLGEPRRRSKGAKAELRQRQRECSGTQPCQCGGGGALPIEPAIRKVL